MSKDNNNIIKRRLLETLALMVVGDSVPTIMAPRKHVSLWQGGPQWWKRTCDTFDRHPTVTRPRCGWRTDRKPHRMKRHRFPLQFHTNVTSHSPSENAANYESSHGGDDSEAKKASAQFPRHERHEAMIALDRPLSRLFISGLSAGVEIGFSLFLMAVVHTSLQDELPPAVVALLTANPYTFGFILVILG